MSKVSDILIASTKDSPMISISEVRATPGKGLEGDRYFEGIGSFSNPPIPKRELTLIEKEKVEAFAKEFDLPFSAKDARRNIVTEGVDLNALEGKDFFVGEVRVHCICLCEPCKRLVELTYPETLKGLKGRGGLRVRILSEGAIRVGDEIRLAD